jgi:hypothetical protein
VADPGDDSPPVADASRTDAATKLGRLHEADAVSSGQAPTVVAQAESALPANDGGTAEGEGRAGVGSMEQGETGNASTARARNGLHAGLAAEEAPPKAQDADLAQGEQPMSLGALEGALVRLLEPLGDLTGELAELAESPELTVWLATLAASTAAFEMVRRRLRHVPSSHGWALELLSEGRLT